MMLLFIKTYLEHDYETLWSKFELILIMWAIVLMAIIIDLVSGVHKATLLGIARTSIGFRETLKKVIQYYSVMCFAFMFDVIASLVVPLPYITMIASAFLVFIEGKSVYEKAEDKLKKKTVQNLIHLATLLENKDDIPKGIAEILKSESEKHLKTDENEQRITQ